VSRIDAGGSAAPLRSGSPDRSPAPDDLRRRFESRLGDARDRCADAHRSTCSDELKPRCGSRDAVPADRPPRDLPEGTPAGVAGGTSASDEDDGLTASSDAAAPPAPEPTSLTVTAQVSCAPAPPMPDAGGAGPSAVGAAAGTEQRAPGEANAAAVVAGPPWLGAATVYIAPVDARPAVDTTALAQWMIDQMPLSDLSDRTVTLTFPAAAVPVARIVFIREGGSLYLAVTPKAEGLESVRAALGKLDERLRARGLRVAALTLA
jgi:hypothetical protein